LRFAQIAGTAKQNEMKKYEFETDQLPPTQATMHGVWVTLAIGVLAFLAAMLLPGSGQAQSTISTYCYSATQGALLERAEVQTYKAAPNGEIYTAEYEGRNTCDYYPDMKVVCITVDGEIETLPAYANAFQDTVTVDVLCTLVGDTPIAREAVVISEPWHEQRQFGFVPYVTAKRQERTFERLGTGITWEWVQIASRYIDPVEGCYQLLPLEEK